MFTEVNILSLLTEEQKKELGQLIFQKLKEAIEKYDWVSLLTRVMNEDKVWDYLVEPELEKLDDMGYLIDFEWLKDIFHNAIVEGLKKVIAKEVKGSR